MDTFHTTYDVSNASMAAHANRYVFSNRDMICEPPRRHHTHYPKSAFTAVANPLSTTLAVMALQAIPPSIRDTTIRYIQNNGQNIQARYRMLMQEGGGNLATIVGPIQPMQMLPVNISWIPTQRVP